MTRGPGAIFTNVGPVSTVEVRLLLTGDTKELDTDR